MVGFCGTPKLLNFTKLCNSKSTKNYGKKYDAAFKAEVLKMLTNGQTPTFVAQSLGIAENIIYRWRRHSNQVGKKNTLTLTNLHGAAE